MYLFMNKLENLFDKETVKNISQIVEDKMCVLNNVEDFQEKDKNLCMDIEAFEKLLSEESKERFDNIMKLSYQIQDYYFTLAYFLGRQHGEQITKL